MTSSLASPARGMMAEMAVEAGGKPSPCRVMTASRPILPSRTFRNRVWLPDSAFQGDAGYLWFRRPPSIMVSRRWQFHPGVGAAYAIDAR